MTTRIGDNFALGLSYSLAAEASGITYQTFNDWMSKGKTEKSGKYYQFYKYIGFSVEKHIKIISQTIETMNTEDI
jgi:hypothetical protein